MAVPTITSVVPSSVPSDSREQVIITGTNFHIWPSLPVPNVGVAVLFRFTTAAGQEEFLADFIEAISATEIRCQAVQYMGLHTAAVYKADVKVVNIDAAGAPIPGESVIKLDAMAYRKDEHLPGATTQRSFLERCFEEFLRMLTVSVNATVAMATHTDYHPDGTIIHFDVAFPLVGVFGVTAEETSFTPYDRDRDREEGHAEEYLPTKYYFIRFQVAPMTDNAAEGLALWEALDRFGQRVKRLYVPKGPGSTNRLKVRIELDGAPEFRFTPSVGVAQATFNCRMGPIPVEAPEIVNRVYALEEALLHAFDTVDRTGSSRERELL